MQGVYQLSITSINKKRFLREDIVKSFLKNVPQIDEETSERLYDSDDIKFPFVLYESSDYDELDDIKSELKAVGVYCCLIRKG